MSAKHILILDYLHIYSDQRMLLQAEALVSSGYRVSIVGTTRFGTFPFFSEDNGITFYVTPLIATYNPLKIVIAFWRWLCGDPQNVIMLPESGPRRGNIISLLFFWLWALRIGCSVQIEAVNCHEHYPLPAAWLLARLRRVPLVYDEHDYLGALPFFEGWKGRIASYVERLFLSRVDAATTVGERLAESLRQHGVRHVITVGSWKRLEDYTISDEQLAAARRELKLEDFKLVISYISILGPNRFIPDLVQAVAETPEVGLLIGGSGIFEPMVRAAAEQSPNIRFLGWVERSKIPLYTCLSDAIYHALDTQGDAQVYFAAPNKLFEAFAAGRPIIGQRGAGEMSDIINAQAAGILLDSITPETLKAALHLLQDPATMQRLSQNAMVAGQRYNWHVARERLHNLYENLFRDRM